MDPLPMNSEMTSIVVSWALTLFGLHYYWLNSTGLQVCTGDVSCAFLQSQCKEKIYTIAGPEFGPKLQGKVLVMNKSIYGSALSKCILP